MESSLQKINLISCRLITHISDIKLIRTDTTLDLSQKAEKGMSISYEVCLFYNKSSSDDYLSSAIWDFVVVTQMRRYPIMDS